MANSRKVSTFWCGKIIIGGADGIRTHYLLTASQTLSQLSYSPAWLKNITKQLGKLKLKQPQKATRLFGDPTKFAVNADWVSRKS
jgi:hypothetical protein